jgi:hypothetical protein
MCVRNANWIFTKPLIAIYTNLNKRARNGVYFKTENHNSSSLSTFQHPASLRLPEQLHHRPNNIKHDIAIKIPKLSKLMMYISTVPSSSSSSSSQDKRQALLVEQVSPREPE